MHLIFEPTAPDRLLAPLGGFTAAILLALLIFWLPLMVVLLG